MSDEITVDITEVADVAIVEIHESPEVVEVVIQEAQDGLPGLSAYQAAVANGFSGTEAEWLESLDGGGVSSISLSVDEPRPNDLRNIYDWVMTVLGLGYDGSAFGDLMLQRAPDYNGWPAWTTDGGPVLHAADAGTAQQSMYVRASDGALILYAFDAVFVADVAYEPFEYNLASWTFEYSAGGGLLWEGPTYFDFPQTRLPSEAAGQIAVWGDAPDQRHFLALAAGVTTWLELNEPVGTAGTYRRVVTDSRGRVVSGDNAATAIAEGGTGATTAKGAVTNLTTIVTNANTAITLTTGDSGTILRCTAATAVTITISGDLGTNFNCLVIQSGAGQITFVRSGSATLNGGSTPLKSAGQHTAVSVLRVASLTYNLRGIEATGSGLPWIQMTNAAYDALASYDANTIYDVTDV